MRKIYPKARQRGTVVILGAGASYGAALKITPPVMSNFIREGRKRVQTHYGRLWDFLKSIGYPLSILDSGSPNLEEIYSILHIVSTGLWHTNEAEFVGDIGPQFWKVPPVYFLESFVTEVLDSPSLAALKRSCAYHDQIVKDLKRGDTVISFNYDLIADVAVWKNRQWSEGTGYGFHYYPAWIEDKDRDCLSSPSDIMLLKPHGSLNWVVFEHAALDYSDNSIPAKVAPARSRTFREKLTGVSTGGTWGITIKLLRNIKDHAYATNPAIDTAKSYDGLKKRVSSDELWKYRGPEKPKPSLCIIPPSTYKFGNPDTPIELVTIWRELRNALSTAARIICIGYSFPPNDMEFKTLFRLALKNNPNERIRFQIINPDQTLQKRIQDISPSLRVVHMADTLQEYVDRGG